MTGFFINTDRGRVATHRQLVAARMADPQTPPKPPWHPVQGTPDASTALYSVMSKQVHGRAGARWIATTCIRHGDYRASLEQAGWEEVDPAEIKKLVFP